ncbi:hypothetical protein A5791_08095 [Mycobacterium sp. 852002-51163_SCH5372311]|uniref:hypothetical protein n=1 Tax=Mycobacterium sp. 852002-51163_SCH5372311 TaxID=1834097 RepID=UPI000800F5FC|nr:hypothetical protein [Mycobacterium sp. 852002-51163_SCH5372311]OBF80540.1 hypothetical protein A5791_08095 [Mycobacterium sp. 852002-51163_SCH5372311]
MSTTPTGSRYVLGHADVEVRRLVSPVAQHNGFGIDELTDTDEFVSRFRAEALAAGALITMPPLLTEWVQK